MSGLFSLRAQAFLHIPEPAGSTRDNNDYNEED